MSYYDINKEKLNNYQMEYYRENRDSYLEYMRVYNHLYYLKRKSERPPKVPKQKKQKEKVPKQRKQKEKVPKPIKQKEIDPTVNESVPVLPTLIFRGEYTLSFD